MAESKRHKKEFITGALLGGLIGAGLALLFAPKPGSQLRSDLLEQSEALRRTGGKVARSAGKGSLSLVKTVSDRSLQTVNKVKEWPRIVIKASESDKETR